jgi:hypothetical protein
MAWGDHKQKVLVPMTPVYAVPTSGVAMAPVGSYSVGMFGGGSMGMAPVASYSVGTVGGAPVGMAPMNGGFNGVYYSSTAIGGAQVGMAPTTYVYQGTGSAPQLFAPGVGNAPPGTTALGNAPTGAGSSRLSDDGKRDVLEDLKKYYQQNKSSESSRSTLRRTMKDEAKTRYVEAIGGDVQAPEDLRDAENREIDLMVDLVMREDQGSVGNAPGGYTYGYNYGYGTGYGTSYGYGFGYAPQPMMYYYVYPVAPTGHHHQHLHHHLHHQKYVMP